MSLEYEERYKKSTLQQINQLISISTHGFLFQISYINNKWYRPISNLNINSVYNLN